MDFFSGKKVLVVAPHADDEVLGCGGTILRALKAGAEVHILVISVGDLVRVGDGGEKRTAHERVGEVEKVRAFLGATQAEVVKTDEYSHMRLDAIPRRDLTAIIERDSRLSLTNLRPEVVFLPSPSYNQDHAAVCQAGLTACRPHDPRALPSPAHVLLYEYPPNSWCLPQDRFVPSFYVDISDHVDKKIEAYKLYESQARSGLHQNSPENVRTLATLRGREIGVHAAEAFQAMRIRV